MLKLLIIHHTPSPNLQAMFEAVVSGATDPEIQGVEVDRRPALSASVSDALEADGYILGTPANLGMMSGALKVFFDLAAEDRFVPPPRAPRRQPPEEPPDRLHSRSCAFTAKNRPMIADVCSQLRVSACSCFRPCRVSR